MATGKRNGPLIHDRNIAYAAGIRPYKLDLRYASVTAFLADKSKKYNVSTAEKGDFFYETTTNLLMHYDGSEWRRIPNISSGAMTFFRWVPKGAPVVSGPAGAAVSGTGQAINNWSLDGLNFQVAPFGTQTILAPVSDTTTGYLDLGSQDQTAGDGIQITPQFQGTSAKMAFTTGTSAAFYTKATFNVATVANVAPLVVGFKIQAAPAALSGSLPNYTEYAAIGLAPNSSSLKIYTNKASGGVTTTDTTQTATNATDFTVEVLCSAAGAWTYKINGSAPTVTAALTATASTVVIPFIAFAQGTAQTSALLKSWECGYQTGAE